MTPAASITRPQAYLRHSTQQRCQAFPIPPFTAFLLRPGAEASENDHAIPNEPPLGDDIREPLAGLQEAFEARPAHPPPTPRGVRPLSHARPPSRGHGRGRIGLAFGLRARLHDPTARGARAWHGAPRIATVETFRRWGWRPTSVLTRRVRARRGVLPEHRQPGCEACVRATRLPPIRGCALLRRSVTELLVDATYIGRPGGSAPCTARYLVGYPAATPS